VASYKTEIEIGVIGVGKIAQLKSSLEQVSKTVDIVNNKRIDQGFNIQNLNTYNSLLNKAWQNINKAAMGSAEELTAVQNLVTAKNRQIAAQQRLNFLIAKEEASQKRIIATSDAGFGQQGPALPSRNRGGKSGFFNPNPGFENLALGAGFPLLFGGGAGQVLGGLGGSFFGSGFGGQILGSAIGGAIDSFITKAGELGSALNPATANIEEVVKALGGTTSAAGAYITKLKNLERSTEALAVATAELEKLVGEEGVQALKTFGEDSTKLQSIFTQAITQMQASLAALVNSTGIFKNLVEGIEYNVMLRQALASEDPAMQDLQGQREKAGRPGFLGGDPQKLFELNDKLVAKQRELNAEKSKEYDTQVKILAALEKSVEQQQANLLVQNERLTYANKLLNQAAEVRQAELEYVTGINNIENARLTTQQKYSLTLTRDLQLNQQIASTRITAAAQELQITKETAATNVLNAKYEAAKAANAATAALLEKQTLAAAGQLDALKRAQLDSTIQEASIAQANLTTVQQVAALTITKAEATERQARATADLELRQQAVALFAADAARSTEQATRAVVEQTAGIDNQLTLTNAIVEAQRTINGIQLETLRTQLDQTTDQNKRVSILNKIRDIEVQNAKLALASTRAQVQADLSRQQVAMFLVQAKYKEYEAVVRVAEAQGVVTRSHYEALDAQASALRITQAGYQTAVRVASIQLTTANAVYQGAVNAANMRNQMERTAAAAEKISGAVGGRGSHLQYGGAYNISDPKLRAEALNVWTSAMARGGSRADIISAMMLIGEIARREAAARPAMAAGGYVTRPTNALIGEGGEPEYVVPQSKASRFAANWMAGNRGESALSRSASPTPASVQVSVQTGPVLQQDGQRYVTLGDLEGAMQTVVNSLLGNGRSAGGRRYTGVA